MKFSVGLSLLRLINQTKVGLRGGEDGAVAASAAAGCVCVGREIIGVSVQTVRCHRVSPRHSSAWDHSRVSYYQTDYSGGHAGCRFCRPRLQTGGTETHFSACFL